MKLIHYHVINKTTKESIYVDCRKYKAEEFMANLPDAENYAIGYKRVTI